MATRIIIDAKWEHTEEELNAAMVLSVGTVQMIETLIADAKQQRFNLSPTPNDYASFIQQEAEIKGAINAYQTLLDCHNNAVALRMATLRAETQDPTRG